MRLVDNWAAILRRAWSIRLALLAAILSGIEVALPFFTPEWPRGWAAAASFGCTGAALVARIVAQPKMLDRKQDKP